jgi:hypothetical protein
MLISIMAMTLLLAGLMCFWYSAWNLQHLPQPTGLAGLLDKPRRIALIVFGFFFLPFGTVMGMGVAVAALVLRPESLWARVAIVWSGVQALWTITAFFQ